MKILRIFFLMMFCAGALLARDNKNNTPQGFSSKESSEKDGKGDKGSSSDNGNNPTSQKPSQVGVSKGKGGGRGGSDNQAPNGGGAEVQPQPTMPTSPAAVDASGPVKPQPTMPTGPAAVDAGGPPSQKKSQLPANITLPANWIGSMKRVADDLVIPAQDKTPMAFKLAPDQKTQLARILAAVPTAPLALLCVSQAGCPIKMTGTQVLGNVEYSLYELDNQPAGS